MKALTTLAIFLMLVGNADARTVDGATIPETLDIAGEKMPLMLNGAGLRTRYMAKVYVVALYLAKPEGSAERILASSDPRMIAITMRRDTDSERIASAFLTSVRRNHDREGMKALNDRLDAFRIMMPSLKRDDVLRLEFVRGGETFVTVNNKLVGTLNGADFQRALLTIWLGKTPVDDELKRALLEGASAGAAKK